MKWYEFDASKGDGSSGESRSRDAVLVRNLLDTVA